MNFTLKQKKVFRVSCETDSRKEAQVFAVNSPRNISPEATKAKDNLKDWSNNQCPLYPSHSFLEFLVNK